MTLAQRFWGLLFCVVGLFGCDHATKMAAKASLENAPAVPIAPGLTIHYVQNDDVAFSGLHALGLPRTPSILIAFSLLAIAILSFAAYKQFKSRYGGTRAALGFALILGGALGNVVDRIARGYVVDFIHIHGWPVFNVADIGVVVGMGLLFISLRRPKEAQ